MRPARGPRRTANSTKGMGHARRTRPWNPGMGTNVRSSTSSTVTSSSRDASAMVRTSRRERRAAGAGGPAISSASIMKRGRGVPRDVSGSTGGRYTRSQYSRARSAPKQPGWGMHWLTKSREVHGIRPQRQGGAGACDAAVDGRRRNGEDGIVYAVVTCAVARGMTRSLLPVNGPG